MNPQAPSLATATSLFERQRYFDAVMLSRDVFNAAAGRPCPDEIQWLRLSIECRLALQLPEQTEALFIRLASLLQAQRKGADATDAVADCYRQALAACPDNANLHLHAGVYYFWEKQLPLAEQCYLETLRLEPENYIAHNNLGNLRKEQGDIDAAFEAYQQALQINPQYAEAHSNLGNWYKDRKRFAEAETHYLKALALRPDFVEGRNNYGVFLQDTERHEESLPHFEHAMAIDPQYTPAYLNLGGTMMNLRRHADAERLYRRALALRPDYSEASFNLGLCLLMQGRMEEGWECFEVRANPDRKVRMSFAPRYPFPRWQGEPLQGKTLLLWPEQGIGDQIMCARYLLEIKAASGAERIVIVCHPALHSLFTRLRGFVPGVDVVAGEKDSIPWCDYWTFIMSVPWHLQKLGAVVPPHTPYLTAQDEQRRLLRPLLESLNAGQPVLKVGLAWKGSTLHARDHLRSPGLAPFTRLLEVQGIRFFNLIPNTREEFSAWAGDAGVDLGHELDQFSGRFEETAALIKELDVVIGCDTSLVHLTGALGTPAWLVLEFAGEWRWVYRATEDGNDVEQHWYPGQRLFRQNRRGDWADVFERVAQALQQEMANAGSR
ncbi:MAG: tetratricopeptide repeat protein [Pseudomonadota bacterium]